MYSLLYFDVEDSFSERNAGSDDIVAWIADELDKVHLKGSFHIIGDKARSLYRRERNDIIEKIKKHDVSSHFNHGSIHPTTVELVSGCDWEHGVYIAKKIEEIGFNELQEIFGKCSAITRHGGQYAPQIVRAAGMHGLPYYGVPFELEEHRAFWFCGNLVFSINGIIINPEQDHPGYLEIESIDDCIFERKLKQIEALIESEQQKYSFTALFGAHPHRLLMTRTSCFNFYNGENALKIKNLTKRPENEVIKLKENYKRYFKFLSEQKKLKIKTMAELKTIYKSCYNLASEETLVEYARQAVDTEIIPLHHYFSPAEFCLAFAENVKLNLENHSLLKTIHMPNIIGPIERFKGDESKMIEISEDDLSTIANSVVLHSKVYGCLLSYCRMSEGRTIYLPAIFDILARSYLNIIDQQKIQFPLKTRSKNTYPEIAKMWGRQASELKAWPVFSKDMDFSKIEEMTKLQTWSVKPAYPHLKPNIVN